MAIDELAPPRPQGERMSILGIDPGKSGAVAVLDEGGELLKVHDTPSTLEPKGRSATNAPLLASILARSHARIAYCEFVGARSTNSILIRGFIDMTNGKPVSSVVATVAPVLAT